MRLVSLAVPLLLTAACQDLPSAPESTVQPLAAIAGGPVVISRGGGTFNFGGRYQVCGGALINATGQTVYQYQVVTHPSGDWMMTMNQRLSMEGTTSSGARFRAAGTGHTSQVIDAPLDGATAYTMTFHRVFVTQGAADNEVYQAVIHWVIDASGKIAVDRIDIGAECRG